VRLRRLAVAALVAAAVLAIPATSGFSATSAERPVEVAVVDDGNAYLGLEKKSPTLGNGTHSDVLLVEMMNNFAIDITDIEVSVIEDDASMPPNLVNSGSVTDSSLGPGETADVTADIDCGNAAGSETFVVDLSAETADGSSVELTRDVEVECTG